MLKIYRDIENGMIKICIVGLGYVGHPLLLEFSKYFKVLGYDIDKRKIEILKCKCHNENETKAKPFNIEYTNDATKIKDCKIIIIAVPTSVDENNIPDLSCIENATRIVGKNLSQHSIVVYESTVYPGVTENLCVKILEEESSLQCIKDFKVGYSPERMNPGDDVHTIANVVKIVSGIDQETLDAIAYLYEKIVKVGVYRASSIQVAEAAKVVENIQRDVNIALINELSIVFHNINLNTLDVLEAAGTKWNFNNYVPGLVGGHCIAVDPYYLIYLSQCMGYNPQLISTAREVNENTSKFVVNIVIQKLQEFGIDINDAKVGIVGITFKENCSDIRNSKVVDIYKLLTEYGVKTVIADDTADHNLTKHIYGMDLQSENEIMDLDVCIFAVFHERYKKLKKQDINSLYKQDLANDRKILIDIKGMFYNNTITKDFCYYAL